MNIFYYLGYEDNEGNNSLCNRLQGVKKLSQPVIFCSAHSYLICRRMIVITDHVQYTVKKDTYYFAISRGLVVLSIF